VLWRAVCVACVCVPFFYCVVRCFLCSLLCCFSFNDPAPTEIYTLSLHDALPILSRHGQSIRGHGESGGTGGAGTGTDGRGRAVRSEEHTSELQSRFDLVCRLLLEKKKAHSRGNKNA